MTDSFYIHPLADVKTTLIGARSKIWQFCVVLPGAKIGSDVNICSHCFIEDDVEIGSRVTVKSGVQLWNGVRLRDEVFIGPNVTFTNDKFPRSKKYPNQFLQTTIEFGASIGAGSIILPGLTIGKHAMIGAGSLVTKSIPDYAIAMGSPATIRGYVNHNESGDTSLSG